MSLPKINVPIFDIEQPSSGKKLKFRPFLVKEEKILLLASEGTNEKEKIEAVKQIINNCCLDENFDIQKTPLFDLEYFFLKLREASVGSKIDLYLQHPNGKNQKGDPCDYQQPSQIDLSQTKIVRDPKHTNKIKLTDSYTLELTYPRIDMIEKLDSINLNNTDDIIRLISECTLRLYDNNEIYDFRDYTIEEKMDFYGSLTQQQFTSLKDFFDTVPKIELEIEYTCDKCGGYEKSVINGISAFL